MAMPDELVSFQQADGIATVVLQHTAKLNVLVDELVEQLHQVMDRAESELVKHIVFRAEGRGFSGGLDLGKVSLNI